MGKRITALKVQKRNKERVNVFLDGEYSMGLSRIVAAWLNVGLELTDEKIAELKSEDAAEVAYQRALNLIGYRMRSSKEIELQLKRNDTPEPVIAKVLERLHRSRLVDDNNFSHTWIENRIEFRPRSRRLLSMELRQKGISDDVIQEALEGITPDEDLAYRAAEKYARKLDSLGFKVFRQKLGGYLARRGFSYDVASRAIERVWNDRGSEEIPEG
jgi:regulatory protein